MVEANKTETRTAHIWLDEDDVLRAVFKSGARETLETARENVDVAAGLVGARKVMVLIDMTPMKEITREARDHYSSEKPASYSIAQALITRSPVSRVIANFFLGLNRPLHPVKLFNSEDAALAWLRRIARAG